MSGERTCDVGQVTRGCLSTGAIFAAEEDKNILIEYNWLRIISPEDVAKEKK